MKPDLRTEDDIRCVVDAFYQGIEKDPVLGRFFGGLDLDGHLPRMYAFWSTIVFQTGGYRGNAFGKHAALEGLTAAHFERWLARFYATVDARYAGETAERMKQKATQIAAVFQVKLGMLGVMDEPATR